jgi:phosphohistidine phosphatase SixA
MLRHVSRGLAWPLAIALVCVAAPSTEVAADDPWALLKKPGHTVLMRHANAPGYGEDPPGIDLKNCALQRNLDEAGKTQARLVGDEFRKRGFRRVRMVSSQFCRALDTAKLMDLGPVEQRPVLNYFNFDDMAQVDKLARETKQFMKSIPANQLAVLVTHISNIKALVSVSPDSGEMVVVHFEPSGSLTVDGRIRPPK